MSALLSRYLYFPLRDVLKGTPVRRQLKLLEKIQWMDAGALEEHTRRSLARTLNAARDEVPFYHARLAAQGQVSAETALEALEQVPILTKGEVFLHREALRARGLGEKVFRGRTSGSGGEALEFFFTRDFLARTEAAQWRGRGWWGMRAGDRMLTLWGRNVADQRQVLRTARRERWKNWLRISAFDLGHRQLASHYKKVREFQPRFIYGYSSAIYQLALFYSEHGLPPPPGLSAIFFTADALLGWQRRLVVEALGAPVVCEYGSSEAGAFAFECREGSVHVSAGNIHLEILRGGRPVADGEEGEVVVTVLHNRAMPLIRYNLGDWARRVPGLCGCGRHLPRIELTNTKVVELVRTARGDAVSGHLFDYILIELIDRGKRGIRQFLVVQKALDRFLVQVVPGPGLTGECLGLFERRMREHLGDEVRVEFQLVAEIPREAAGKIRYFRSELEAAPESRWRPPAAILTRELQ
jgi:phenylacetate-CoA ligase